MVEDHKHGTVWVDVELDAIVADYFSMLAAELSGEPYVKSHHSAVMMERIGRTHRSVEFKHQNISAVLAELGLPWIPGYKPKENYQNSIFGAIDRYLSAHPGVFQIAPKPPLEAPSEPVFVPAPSQMELLRRVPERLTRLIRKFDPAERDARNRSLGRAGEEFVLDVERSVLARAGRPDLARSIRWVAMDEGDGAGFDILSFDPSGRESWIEVKTTNGGPRTPFFLSRNELKTSAGQPDRWKLYRVHSFTNEPRIFILDPPLESAVSLSPESWRASFISSPTVVNGEVV